MKKTLFLAACLMLSFTVMAGPNYKGYAEAMKKPENAKKLKEMDRACKQVNNAPTDPDQCSALARWQIEQLCKYGVIADKTKCTK